MRAELLPLDAPEHSPSFADSFNEKDQEPDTDTPSAGEHDAFLLFSEPQSTDQPPYQQHSSQNDEDDDGATMLDLEDTGLQLSLFSSDTQKTTESNGNESDAESFATASSFTGPAIAADHQETGTGGIDVQAGTSGSVCSQSRCRRIRFQDARVEGDVGVVYGTPRSLDNNNLPAITPSESEGRQLQEKADFSSPGHEAITAGGPMEERHTSGLGPMMAKIKSDALQHSSGDSPASLEGGHGLDSNKTEVENEKVKSMDAAGVDAEMPQVQEGAVRTSWFCHPLTDAVAKIASPFLVPTTQTHTQTQAPLPLSPPPSTLKQQPSRKNNSTLARAWTDPLLSLVPSLASLPPSYPYIPPTTPAIRLINCECGRVIESIIPPAPAAYFQDPRQRQFTCDKSTNTTPAPTRPPLRFSYFVPLSSFLPSYQESLSSWRDSFIAPSSHASFSHIHIPNDGEEDDDDDETTQDAAPGRPSTQQPNGNSCFLGHNSINNIGNHGVSAAVERLAGLVMSTGQATLDYIKGTVAPTAIHVARRSASSTIGFLTSHISGPSAVPSMLPRFVGEGVSGHQTADHSGNTGAGTGTHSGHQADTEPIPDRRFRSTMDSRGLGDRMTRSAPNLTTTSRSGTGAREPSIPDLAHHRSRRSTTPTTSSTAMTTVNRPRRTCRTTLQAIPGPDGLDPETRRRLEAQGLSALGLRDENAGDSWRNWWDPRRYGFKKYIICHQIRTPRPCTTILFLILIVCTIPPVVIRRK